MVVRNKNPKNSMQKFNDDFESAKFLNLNPFLSDFFKKSAHIWVPKTSNSKSKQKGSEVVIISFLQKMAFPNFS